MKTVLFDYHLPSELITNSPVSPRDHSKLLVIDRKLETTEHKHFYNIVDYLTKNDVLVLNQTKVFPARLYGHKESGGTIELLLTKNTGLFTWEALARPGLGINKKILFDGFDAVVKARNSELHEIEFSLNRDELLGKLEKIGATPLPPYIHSTQNENDLRKEYQTVYAKDLGSIAAPTAGFHFTKKLLEKIRDKGIQIEYVTLHVGIGTFAPVKTETLEEHHMHSEEFEISADTVKRLNSAKQEGKRIISVGTTSTRVLETLSNKQGLLKPTLAGSTDIFIYPPYKFKFVDTLITNFHLPKSTLLALISAFVSFPNTASNFTDFKNSLTGKAYKEAIENKYRFYSFGDSMIIL